MAAQHRLRYNHIRRAGGTSPDALIQGPDDGHHRVIDTHEIRCPYCGERLELAVEWTIRHQEYIEDCEVCCRPITLVVTVDSEQKVDVKARAESE